MAQALTLSPSRILKPVTAFVIAIAFIATLALGFGIRTWTESTTGPAAPSGAVHAEPSHALDGSNPAPATPLRKAGRPF